MALRLMILSADYPPRLWSGIGAAVAAQAAALARAGAQVHVLLAGHCASARGHEENDVFVHSLERSRFPLDARRFDIVHLHSLALAELALELRRRFGLPVVYTAHSLIRHELANSPIPLRTRRLWAATQERLIAACDRVVFVSETEFQTARTLLSGMKSRMHCIPNGIAPASKMPPLPSDGPIVFAGRFTYNKGIDTFLAMVRELCTVQRARIVIAGAHGEPLYTLAVRQTARQHPDCCEYAGWLQRAELDTLFSRAALVVVPSRYEPFGMVALEALRVGAPVLAANAGNLPALLDGCAGSRIVASRDPEAWKTAAIQMLRDDANRKRAWRCGPQHIATRFADSLWATRLINEIYQRCFVARNRIAWSA